MRHTPFRFCVCLAACMVFFLAAGCGKKGAPLPPEMTGGTVSAPENLTARPDGNRVLLTWTHTKGEEPTAVNPVGFEISAAVPAGCEGCPFVFKAIGMVSMPATSFTARLDSGKKYYFRVQAVGPNDIRSEFSKPLAVEIE